ncbi:MAG: glycosyltransferase [Lachnospiraceae bacterium]|jgi:glycosyltransferase involved in cell wall biosynthesis|nr:glycosyltransferase [Lachnospiraceae bacterium]
MNRSQQIISIIVPVYNAAAFLDRCVQSLLKKRWTALEIILVDDGSTDESGALCDRYAQADDRVRVIHQANGGLMVAWQAGVAESTGSYLCFVDSDDWVESVMIEEMAAHLDLGGGEVICCNHLIERSDRSVYVKHGLAPGCYEGEGLAKVFRGILGNEQRLISFSRCMKLINRELIENNLVYCNKAVRMGEDVNIILPARLDSRRIVIMADGYFYHYLYNDMSMVHAYDPGLYENIRLLGRIIREIFQKKAVLNKLNLTGQEIDRQCGQEYLFLLMLVLKNEARGNRQGNEYLKNIKMVGRMEQTPKLVASYPVILKEKANRLLWMVLRYPYGPFILLLRMAMKGFYGLRERGRK